MELEHDPAYVQYDRNKSVWYVDCLSAGHSKEPENSVAGLVNNQMYNKVKDICMFDKLHGPKALGMKG